MTNANPNHNPVDVRRGANTIERAYFEARVSQFDQHEAWVVTCTRKYANSEGISIAQVVKENIEATVGDCGGGTSIRYPETY